MWAEEAKKFKIVTEVVDSFPDELIFGSMEFTLELGEKPDA